jgi:hypothetical protein
VTFAVVSTKAFDALLVVHAICAIAALAVLIALRAAAIVVARDGPRSELVARTFTGRPELAGRVVYLVPLTGIAVTAVSLGAYSVTSGFVEVGFALWVVTAMCLELAAFPAQREVAASLEGSAAAARIAAGRMARAIELAALALVAAAIVMIVTTSL